MIGLAKHSSKSDLRCHLSEKSGQSGKFVEYEVCCHMSQSKWKDSTFAKKQSVLPFVKKTMHNDALLTCSGDNRDKTSHSIALRCKSSPLSMRFLDHTARNWKILDSCWDSVQGHWKTKISTTGLRRDDQFASRMPDTDSIQDKLSNIPKYYWMRFGV